MSTNIEWTDVTDNIIRVKDGGWFCLKISPGCKNCYAEKLNQNTFFGGNHQPYGGKVPELILDHDLIGSWARMNKPKRHFVASMTDIFGEWVPKEWVYEFLSGMAAAPLQTFQLLTKRPHLMAVRISEWLSLTGRNELPKHIQLGVSVENQDCADWRIPELLKIPAAVRFLSVEPMLEAIQFKIHWFPIPIGDGPERMEGIDWIIFGGESGKDARPCNVDWIRAGVKQCQAAGVAAFVKQLGGFSVHQSVGGPMRDWYKDPKGGEMTEWPEDLRIREFPNPCSSVSIRG